MNINHIEYLMAIREQGSISKAAQKLFVSAPAISLAVKSMEEELGYPLLIRLQNGVKFSEEGKEALEIFRDIQKSMEQLKMIGERKKQVSGEFVIASNYNFSSSFVIPAIVNLKRKFPNLKFHLKTGDSYAIISLVEQGKADFGLILRCKLDEQLQLREISRNSIERLELFKDEMRFLVRADHPLVQKKELNLSDLINYPLVCYVDTFNRNIPVFFRELFHLSEVDGVGKAPDNIMRVNDKEDVFSLLMESDGIALIPYSNKFYIESHYSNLTYLPISDPRLVAKVSLIYKENFSNHSMNILIQEFKEFWAQFSFEK